MWRGCDRILSHLYRCDEEAEGAIARIQGEGELLMADVINIGQLYGGSQNVLVEWIGLDGEPWWEPVGIFRDAPAISGVQPRKMGLSSAVKQGLRRRHGISV